MAIKSFCCWSMSGLSTAVAAVFLALVAVSQGSESKPVAFGGKYEYWLSGIQDDVKQYNVIIVLEKSTGRTAALQASGSVEDPFVASEGGFFSYYDLSAKRVQIYEIDEGMMDDLNRRKPDNFINEIQWFRRKRVDGLGIRSLSWKDGQLELLLIERPGVHNPVIVRIDCSTNQIFANKNPGSVFETLYGGVNPQVLESKKEQ